LYFNINCNIVTLSHKQCLIKKVNIRTVQGGFQLLYITLREGDYFMVGGNVKITYERTTGKDRMFIGIDAPRDVQVLRGQMYENEIAKLAEAGDPEAQEIHRKLLEEYEGRTRKYTARHTGGNINEANTAQGLSAPNETVTRHIQRMERGRKTLAGELAPGNTKDWGIAKADLSPKNEKLKVAYRKKGKEEEYHSRKAEAAQ
jgi:sRNA-binding carbon storage regulator CsrA